MSLPVAEVVLYRISGDVERDMSKEKVSQAIATFLLIGLLFPISGLLFGLLVARDFHDLAVLSEAREHAEIHRSELVRVEGGVAIVAIEGQSAGSQGAEVPVYGDYEPADGVSFDVHYLPYGDGYAYMGKPSFFPGELLYAGLVSTIVLLVLIHRKRGLVSKFSGRLEFVPGVDDVRRARFLVFAFWLTAALVASVYSVRFVVEPFIPLGLRGVIESKWLLGMFLPSVAFLFFAVGLWWKLAHEVARSTNIRFEFLKRVPLASARVVTVGISAVAVPYLVWASIYSVVSSPSFKDVDSGSARVASVPCDGCEPGAVLEYEVGGVDYSTRVSEYPDDLREGRAVSVEWESEDPSNVRIPD